MTHPHVIAMRRRIARIRRLVAAFAVAAFLVLFSTIYVQMAAGNDPVLASTTSATTTTDSSDSTTTDSSESTATDSSDSTTTDSSDSDSEPAAVTTAQS